jgi:hypothetical protein
MDWEPGEKTDKATILQRIHCAYDAYLRSTEYRSSILPSRMQSNGFTILIHRSYGRPSTPPMIDKDALMWKAISALELIFIRLAPVKPLHALLGRSLAGPGGSAYIPPSHRRQHVEPSSFPHVDSTQPESSTCSSPPCHLL